jgi:hypothetical protein
MLQNIVEVSGTVAIPIQEFTTNYVKLLANYIFLIEGKQTLSEFHQMYRSNWLPARVNKIHRLLFLMNIQNIM